MTEKQLTKLSKKMSYVLRHHPEEFGLTIEDGGWLQVSLLAEALEVSFEDIIKVVTAPSDKTRFTISARLGTTHIRAAQGHSVDVDLKLVPVVPPDMLFHGTHVGALSLIFDGGLKKMNRTHVHLSESSVAAVEVGARRGKPILIQVNTLQAHCYGIKFYRADNGVWLSEDIPPKYLTATIL